MCQSKYDKFEVNETEKVTYARYRKKQKRTNTYDICDKRNTRSHGRNQISRLHIHLKFETRKSYNLYRLYEKFDV